MTGKEKCNLLKAMRKEIAQANGIEYAVTECTYEGECPGHCPQCDAEAKHIDSELNRLASEGKEIKISTVQYQPFWENEGRTENEDEFTFLEPQDDIQPSCNFEAEKETDETDDMVVQSPHNKPKQIDELIWNEAIKEKLYQHNIVTIDDLIALTLEEVYDILSPINHFPFIGIRKGLKKYGLSFKGDEIFLEDIVRIPTMYNERFDIKIEDLNLTLKAYNALFSAGIRTVNDIKTNRWEHLLDEVHIYDVNNRLMELCVYCESKRVKTDDGRKLTPGHLPLRNHNKISDVLEILKK